MRLRKSRSQALCSSSSACRTASSASSSSRNPTSVPTQRGSSASSSRSSSTPACRSLRSPRWRPEASCRASASPSRWRAPAIARHGIRVRRGRRRHQRARRRHRRAQASATVEHTPSAVRHSLAAGRKPRRSPLPRRETHGRQGQPHRSKPLTNKERIEELSRMLGGIEVTARTRAHAAEMIDRAGR